MGLTMCSLSVGGEVICWLAGEMYIRQPITWPYPHGFIQTLQSESLDAHHGSRFVIEFLALPVCGNLRRHSELALIKQPRSIRFITVTTRIVEEVASTPPLSESSEAHLATNLVF